MNSFLFSAITLCLAAQCALAQYQSTPSYGYQQQRKMAPTPQTYVQPQQQQYDAGNQYSAMEQQQQQSSYGTKGGYEAASAAPAYGGKQQSAGYGKQAAAAAKYEEPYYPQMPFAWGYDINDGYGGAQYHKENGDEYGKRTGSYGYTDAYGIYRQVDYVADENGFRATIKTNEPGTANESPASVDLHAYEPPSNYYAGKESTSYTTPKSSYAAPAAAAAPVAAAAAAPSYQPQRQTYSAPVSHRQQYSQPRASAATPMAAYGKSTGSYQRQQPIQQQQQQQYQPTSSYANEAAQYMSSVIVPVYQKSAQAVKVIAAPVAAKRAY